jgi:lipoprotein signal peptidase
MKKAIVFFLLLLGLDVAAKLLSLEFIPSMIPKIFGYPYGGIPIFNCLGITFSLNTVVNSGAAWGFFQGHSGLLFMVRTVIVAGLIGYLIFFNRGKTAAFPLWLVVIGAIGNGIDYLAYGHVIDFFHFCFWGTSFPIFNLADCYITIGVLSLFLFSRPAQLRSI